MRATLTEEATSSVIQNYIKSISIAAAVKLPSRQNLAKIVRRKRKAPEEDFSEYVHTTRGEQFLISNHTGLDLIILGTGEIFECWSDILIGFAMEHLIQHLWDINYTQFMGSLLNLSQFH